MTNYIALLRGINVSGQKKILMADLKALFDELGFTKVQTYIQSGNVVFEDSNSEGTTEISAKIGQGIFKRFGYDVPVLVLNAAKLHVAWENNPFLREDDIDATKLHLTLLSALPEETNLHKISNLDFSPDRFIIDGQNIYLYCPKGFGRTKLTNTFFESKLKIPATTRNWRTITTLVEMAQELNPY